MHKIVALWAVPRSTSTAFEWMMRQRGDIDCLHEPLVRPGIKVKTPCSRLTPNSTRTPD